MPSSFWQTLLLTFQLATITTLLLLFIGIPLAAFLAYRRRWYTPILETLVSMPLVLPPTVLGFYLLLAFSPENGLGRWLDQAFDIRLVFTFTGLVIGSLIYSLPFMVQPIQSGFQNLSLELREAAYTLGKSRWQTL